MCRLDAQLTQGAANLGVSLSAEQVHSLLALVTLLQVWNQTYNLTAIRDPQLIVAQHVLDSLTLTPYLRGERILDVGTGAGFPGLPLAMTQPQRTFTLLDSNGKKVRFVRQAVLELGLGNVEVVQVRVEAYNSATKFTTVMARAFSSLAVMWPWMKPLLEPAGILLAPKGHDAALELAALDLGIWSARCHQLQVPCVDGERTLVEIFYQAIV